MMKHTNFPSATVDAAESVRARPRFEPAQTLGLTTLALIMFLAAMFGASSSARGEVIANWGTVVNSAESSNSFTFAESGISKNFSHDYLFSLEGSAGATYSVTFNFSDCGHGCGNANVTYGIYDANGGLVAVASSGTVTLAAGNYSFQVKGTGMGAGNSVDYNGNITFTAVAADVVSPAPEPSTYLLTLIGLTLVGWVGHRNGMLRSAGNRSGGPGGALGHSPMAAG